MEIITFTESKENLKYAIIVKKTAAHLPSIQTYYVKPLLDLGLKLEEIMLVTISSSTLKLKAAEAKIKLLKAGKALRMVDIQHVLVPNGDLYKFITNAKKPSECFGETVKGAIEGFKDINIVLSIDYNALLHSETLRFKLDNSLQQFYKVCTNTFKIQRSIIRHRETPITGVEIAKALHSLHQYDAIGCDIETESLRFERARIITIAFTWSQHAGIVFSLDTDEEDDIKTVLLKFFLHYKGTLKFHGALYDLKVIIYQLFMEDSLDMDGLRKGLKCFDGKIEDSMIVTYLATNSTQENPLGLKDNAFEFAGNYGIEFKKDKDVHKYEREEVLVYNLKDALCIWYVEAKHWPTLVADDQEQVYREIMLPSIMPLLYMMLIGMPMNMEKVNKANSHFDKLLTDLKHSLSTYFHVSHANNIMKAKRLKADNTARLGKAVNPDKIKIKTLEDIADEPFNPGSPQQLSVLLYDVLDMPVLNTTVTGTPSTDNKTLAALVNHADDPEKKEIVQILLEYKSASTISGTFIKNFINYAFIREDGSAWLNGSKKLGGTQSGRLSGSDPNLENIPSKSQYGGLIKECFEAPEGFLFGGADFASLEDRINAILTQDPQKIKVYSDGFDGHCLRAKAYFGDEMPDITDTVESINSITLLYDKLRQKSKVPTFALTYKGTWRTLVNNLGLTEELAKQIDYSYHELYKVSDQWSEKKIAFASENGFLNCAFGLRIRTPLLKQALLTKKHNLFAAEAEGRSAVNAVTQSWGMLINRTAIAFVHKLLQSEFVNDIYPINTVHDAIYFIFRDDPNVIKWLNDNLIEAMEWNNHPLIQSDLVPMAANLDIGKNWLDQITLPNRADIKHIIGVQKIINENTKSNI